MAEPTWDDYLAAVRALWGDDMDLMRLVIEYGEACNSFAVRVATAGEVSRAEAAIREHIAQHYVRRDDPRYRILERASEAMVTFGGLRSTHCADCGTHILVEADDAVDLCDSCVTRRIHHDTNRQPLPPLTPTPADVDAGKCRWTDHGWEWTDYRAARGILPSQPGDELPEDAIRRVRDGE